MNKRSLKPRIFQVRRCTFPQKQRKILCIINHLLICAGLFGSPTPIQSSLASELEQPTNEPSLTDTIHTQMSGTVTSLAESLDHFFSNKRTTKEAQHSSVHIFLISKTDEVGRTTFVPQAGARLSLPNTEDRLRLVVESGIKTFAPDETTPIEVIPQAQQDDSWFSTALQYIFFTSDQWNAHNKTGINIRGATPDLFTGLYLRYHLPIESFNTRLSEEFVAYAVLGLTDETRLEADRRLSEGFLLRFTTKRAWQQQENKKIAGQYITLFQRISGGAGLSYSAGAIGNYNAKLHLEAYTFDIRYRRKLWRPWFFIEAKPYIELPAARSFKLTPAFYFTIETVFGNT